MSMLTFKGLVPVLPLAPQLLRTLWAVVAPHLLVLSLLLSPLVGAWLVLLGGLALLWMSRDAVASHLLPWAPRERLLGLLGGRGLGRQRTAMEAVAASYRPTPWLLGGDQRTLAVVASGLRLTERLEQHRVPGPRGELLLHLRASATGSETAPIVLVIGGIVGDPDSPFIQHLQLATEAQGWGFGLWVTRPDLLPGSLASAPDPADVRDIHECLRFVRARRPGAPVFLVGYSMGASMVLLYCGRLGWDALCDAAVSVAGSFTMLPLFCPHYRSYWQPWLTAQLKVLFYERFGFELPPKETVVSASTYQELIDRLPHVGPVSRLVEMGSPGSEMRGITVPVLFFASADDPFHHPVQELGIDTDLESVLYYITGVGGHCGWPEGWAADCSRFHPRVVLGFLQACLVAEGRR